MMTWDSLELPTEPGAYLLVIVLDDPLPLDAVSLAPAVLRPGCYVYCGSAYGPGGLRARVRRHLRCREAMTGTSTA